MVEHRLSVSISRVILLARCAMEINSLGETEHLVPNTPKSLMLRLVQEVFDLDHLPMMLNVRHLFTSIGNILCHQGVQEDGMVNLVSDRFLTEKSGHTQSTGMRSYATWVENSEEALYDFYHQSLGESVKDPPPAPFVPFPSRLLLRSLRELLGRHTNFRTKQQEEMVRFCSNSIARHAFVSMPCGHGKSLSWMVPTLASLLSGR